MKIVQRLKETLKEAFSPLGDDKAFTGLVILAGMVLGLVELLSTSVTIYLYFYNSEMFSYTMDVLRGNWHGHLCNMILSGVLIWFGIHLRRKISKEKQNGRN